MEPENNKDDHLNPEEEPLVLVGRQFREQREAEGIHIEAAAQALFIDKKNLKALENDNLEAIGSPVFVRGYAKSYARYLGLDVDQIAAMLEPYLERMEQRNDRTVQLLDGDRETRAELDYGKAHFNLRDSKKALLLPYLTVLVLLVVLAAFLSFRYFSEDSVESYQKLELPIEPQKPNASAQPDRADPKPQVDETSQIEILPGDFGKSASITDDSNDNSTKALDSSTRRLLFAFRGNSWLNIVDANKQEIASRIFFAGETVEFVVEVPASVVLGKANQASMQLNDEPFDYTSFVRGDIARFTVK